MAIPGRDPQPPTELTRLLNEAVARTIPDRKSDPEWALAKPNQKVDFDATYQVDRQGSDIPVWSLRPYAFLEAPETRPLTVNPSLYRNAQLNMNCGLYEVIPDRVFQIRGGDLANISFLEAPGTDEIVVVDPLGTMETAASAMQVYRSYGSRQSKWIGAVIHTHSHVDHYGGVRGLFRTDEERANATIFAPEGFVEHAVSENVYAGNAMSRRAEFMYGALLHRGEKGQVDAGLGKSVPVGGTISLLTPDVTIDSSLDGQTIPVGPLEITFQLTPGTEAPTEMNFYIPAYQALCMAENATPTLHNLYSLRGAQVRDAKVWSQYLRATIDLFGQDAKYLFASHFWPRPAGDSGTEIVDFLTSQADMYRFLHDQALRLANKGYTMLEIAEDLQLPDSLSKQWYNHGYYGTVNHDLKAVYQRYLGWYDGNAAHLHTLPPEKVARRYVEAMGGALTVVKRAEVIWGNNQATVEDYRWAVEMLSHVVFADPHHEDAKLLEAAFLEQLGYQAESGPWRNYYLAAAQELRYRPVPAPKGKKKAKAHSIISDDVIDAMPLEMVFDYMGIRLDGPAAAKLPQPPFIQIFVTDDPTVEGGNADILLRVRNGVLVYTQLSPSATRDDPPSAVYRMTRAGINAWTLGTAPKDLSPADLTILQGTIKPISDLNALLEPFEPTFPLTLP
ncbi:alkyl/aryl-sulfatase [Nonomuraea sediminis]|uniref:alkyl/aryl-sulfatase n=1 Tax=Nonomuraea sediminis TaxID=2835864 RepID=UPI001BDD3350|nr:alkyl sulfatase dimerization domain-containing protein [Nonomuraea sediminis]